MSDNAEFHLRDGWYFRREYDGTVVVRVQGDGDNAERGIYIPPNEWASIVHAVAAPGASLDLIRDIHARREAHPEDAAG